MRTTLSLDDDVAALLDEEMRKSGRSFKETVNGLLRLGLRQGPAPTRFVVEPRELGLPAGMSYDNVQELLDQLDSMQ